MASFAVPAPPPPKAAAAAAAMSLASHNPSIDENEKPIVSGSTSKGKLSSSSSSAAPPPHFAFRQPQPTVKEKLRSYLLSTHFQCAVQLTVGVAFLSLFVLVDKMRFPMSCQAAVIYGKMRFFLSLSFFFDFSLDPKKITHFSSPFLPTPKTKQKTAALTLQLFHNVHMGGRIAAAAIATGCIFIGALFGGTAVSIAWAAKGANKNSLIKAVKQIMAGPPSPEKAMIMRKIAAAQSAKVGAATGAAAAAKPKPTLGEAMAFLNELPIVGQGYYVVFSLVGVAAMALFAVVRCDPKNNAVGGLGSILAVVTGLVIANAGAVPVIGLRAFWGAVVIRIIQLGLVASAATLVSGVLVMPTKASDALTRTLATAISGVGTSVTGFGRMTEAARLAKEAEAEADLKLQGGGGGGGKAEDPEAGLVGETLKNKSSKRRRAGRSAAPAGRSTFFAEKLAEATAAAGGKTLPSSSSSSTRDLKAAKDTTDREILARLRDDSTPPAVAHDGSVIDGLSDDEIAGDGDTSEGEEEDEEEGKSGSGNGGDDEVIEKSRRSRSLHGSASAPLRRADGSASLPAGHGLAEPVTWWRCHLSEANTLLAESRFEPPSLFSGPASAGGFRPGKWAKVIAKTDSLIARAAALEELCASPGAPGASGLLRKLHGGEVGGTHREALGASAAALASLARLLRDPRRARELWVGRAPGLHGPEVWGALQQLLAEAARGLQGRYWEALEGTRKRSGGGDGAASAAAESWDAITSHGAVIAMRGYHHAAMLSGGLIEARQVFWCWGENERATKIKKSERKLSLVLIPSGFSS